MAPPAFLLATRPGFLTASLLPVCVGTAWGQRVAGSTDWTAFGLAALAIVLLHAGANVLNDVGDDIQGSDRVNAARVSPYTGGSRFIQDGLLTRRRMASLAVALAVLGAIAGIALTARKGAPVLALGGAGVVIAWAYSLPPAQLASRGLGELAVGLAFGVLPVAGAAWLQSGVLDAGATCLGLAVAGWVMAILLINEVPDIPADAAVGKRTLAVRLGRKGVAGLYALAYAVPAAALLGGALNAGLPAAAAVVAAFLLLPGTAVVRTLLKPSGPLRRSIETTLASHALGAIGLTIAVLAG